MGVNFRTLISNEPDVHKFCIQHKIRIPRYLEEYSSIPNKRTGSNKRTGWNFDKKNKRTGWNFDQNTRVQGKNCQFYS